MAVKPPKAARKSAKVTVANFKGPNATAAENEADNEAISMGEGHDDATGGK